MPAATELDLGIHTRGLTITGEDPVALSLGGAESAVVWVARALQRLGHRVTVACKTDRERQVAGVTYLPEERLLSGAVPCPRDLLISCRFFLEALQLDLPARVKGLWLHDPPEEESVRGLRQVLPRASFCFFLSRFHRAAYLDTLPELAPIARLTRNGVDQPAIDELLSETPDASPGAPLRFIFGSRPIRGLETLLAEIWPQVHALYPQAELLVTCYDIEDLLVDDPERRVRARAAQAHYDRLVAAAPGARYVGPLTRRQFWREMTTCRAVLYPTDTPEVSCLVALEAQALGVPIVTTKDFALRETVGFAPCLISDPWGSADYTRSFVEQVRRLVEDSAYTERVRQAGREHVRHGGYTWDHIAAEWTDIFQHSLTRPGSRPKTLEPFGSRGDAS
ncbi:MAG: glycosyltransferase family 4 protein [Acidobacteriota bacterium]